MATTASEPAPPEEPPQHTALVLHFDDDSSLEESLEVEPWVIERFEYFGRLQASGFAESEHGEARLPCRRAAFEHFLSLASGIVNPSAIDLMTRMEVLRFADMFAATEIVRQLSDSIRTDYLSDGDGARDSTVTVLCELADLLAPPSGSPGPMDPSVPAPTPPVSHHASGAHLAPATPSPAAVWLISTRDTPAPLPSAVSPVGATPPTPANEPGDPLAELREACLEALPPWTRQRFAEKPQLWRLRLRDVLSVYGAEASPRAESSWLALHAARRLCPDILPFASAGNDQSARLVEEHPEMVIQRCTSLCVRELPFTKAVSGFGGTGYTIQVALNSGKGGGWVLGVGGQGLCALRKVVLEVESKPGGGGEPHELEFTGMEHATGRQEDGVLGFASGVQHIPLPFMAKLTMLEFPLHLAVQTYLGLNFNTMALLCNRFEFGPMDLACVMDLWLQSDQLRRVPEQDISRVVKRTLSFVSLSWAPVVRISFIVCMHSCWMQARHVWWHTSLIRSCMDLQVWRGPADGEPGAGTFRSYVMQIVQHALSPHPEVFLRALQEFLEAMPPITLNAVENFFPAPKSLSDPVAVVARHYLQLLRQEAAASEGKRSPEGVECAGAVDSATVMVNTLMELLDGFKRLVGPPLERSDPKTVVLAFMALAALCDLRYQRRLCAESVQALLCLECRAVNGPEAHFWGGCFFTVLEFSYALSSGSCADDETR